MRRYVSKEDAHESNWTAISTPKEKAYRISPLGLPRLLGTPTVLPTMVSSHATVLVIAPVSAESQIIVTEYTPSLEEKPSMTRM